MVVYTIYNRRLGSASNNYILLWPVDWVHNTIHNIIVKVLVHVKYLEPE